MFRTRYLVRQSDKRMLFDLAKMEISSIFFIVGTFAFAPLFFGGTFSLVFYNPNKPWNLIITLIACTLPFVIFLIFLFVHISRIRKVGKFVSTNDLPGLVNYAEEILQQNKKKQSIVAIAGIGDFSADETLAFLKKVLHGPYVWDIRIWTLFGLKKIGSRETINVIASSLNDVNHEIRKTAEKLLDKLAAQKGFDTRSELLQNISYQNDYPSISKTKIRHKFHDFSDELEKEYEIHYIDSVQDDLKCMISNLEIHPELNDVLACPHCFNMARKDLLEEWLWQNSICPVCKRELHIEDCLLVKIRL